MNFFKRKPKQTDLVKSRFDFEEEVKPVPPAAPAKLLPTKEEIEQFLKHVKEKHRFDSIHGQYRNAVTLPPPDRIPRISEAELDALLSVVSALPVNEGVELIASLCRIGDVASIPATHAIFNMYNNKCKLTNH